MKRVLCASDDRAVGLAVNRFQGFEVVGDVDAKSLIARKVLELKPDILLMTEDVSGSEALPEIVMRLARELPELRVVFLTGPIDLNSPERRSFFEALVFAGVYDIVYEPQITTQILREALENPKTKEDVAFLLPKTKDIKKKKSADFPPSHKDSYIARMT